jgi:hypothetical protein
MSPQLADNVETVGLNLASITLFVWSFHWMGMMEPMAKVLGVVALAANIALALRKLYMSFDRKRHRDDDEGHI